MKLTWKNYTIRRLDEHNLVVEKTGDHIATKNYHSHGVLTIKKGEVIRKTLVCGYFSTISRALAFIIQDAPTYQDINTLEELRDILKGIRQELRSLMTN